MKIGILTCINLPNLLPSEAFLIPALTNKNHIVTAVIWDDVSIEWSDFDLLIFRNTWDYYEKQTAFDIWLNKIEALGMKCLNSIKTIQKNKHKFYLKKLQNQGISIVPTVFIDKTTTLDLQKIIPKHWQKAVIKPAYSGGSYQTVLFDVIEINSINKDYQSIAAEKELLLQEYIPEIKTVGETSFIFFNKKFSHCVNKMPVKGDFRVQNQYGGIYTIVHPSQELIDKAQNIVNTFAEDLLYVRIDCIVFDNNLLLMEVECLEPDLYFELCPSAKDKFIEAIERIVVKSKV